LAAEHDELVAVVRPQPRGALLRVHRLTAGQVPGETHQRLVPADTHRAKPELGPQILGDVGDMLQLQPDPPVRPLAEAYLDPAALATELPGGGEAVRRVATPDRAAPGGPELGGAAPLQRTGDAP